jgi:hypothetical protein
MLPMKKLLLVVSVGILLVAGAIAWLWTTSLPSPLRSAFEKIQVGMTRAEVDAILGESDGGLVPNSPSWDRVFPEGSSGDAGFRLFSPLRQYPLSCHEDSKFEVWGLDLAESVVVEFDDFSPQGIVVSKKLHTPTTAARARERLQFEVDRIRYLLFDH